jgi:hypothetical protein
MNISQSKPKVEWALEWGRRGFRVFPLRQQSKEPLAGSDWTNTATSDPDEIRRAWQDRPNANIGVLTSDLIVIDVDVKGGKKGLESLIDLGIPMDTLTTRTPSGGLHLYFNGPDRANSAGKVAPGIDIRSFHGYVVAPGSTTPKGAYTISNEAPVLDAPESLIARLDMPRERSATASAPLVEMDRPLALDMASRYLTEEAKAPDVGGRNDALFLVAAHVKDCGVSEPVALDLIATLWNTRLAVPLDREEIEKTVGSAYANGKLRPGSLSPEAHYADVSIPPIEEMPAPAARRFFRHGDSWDDATRWLYFGLLPAAGTALLVGPSGAGKSFLAIGLAVSLATGRPFFGVAPDERGGTIYVATEAQATLAKRLEAAAPSSAPLAVSICGAGALSDAKQLKSLFDDIAAESAAMKDRFGVPCRLIVFDTLSASGLLTDENDNAKAAIALAELQRLSTATGALVLATHHPPKDGKGERGAGALRANVDAILTVQHEAKAKVRDLELTKSRDAEAPRSLGSYELKEVELSKDARGRAVTTCVVVSALQSPKSKRQPPYCEEVKTAIDHALTADGEMFEGRRVVRKALAQEQFQELGPKDSGNRSRAFSAALAWLVEHGHAQRVEQFGRECLTLLKVNL